uniref:Carboxypeptidase regulatory-like domain-containing protein n=1 Tax=Schlesneria paludicola TaxID=360056 RepID=A0A7C4QRZ5_9PLAN
MCSRQMLAAAPAVALLITGCGGGEATIKTVPVSGTVVYKGQPVEGATVSFWGEKAPRAASGITNEKGEFKLSMFKLNDGAVPGPNKVTVVKEPPRDATPAPAGNPLEDPTQMARMAQEMSSKKATGEKPLIPARYASQSTTPLVETVPESGSYECVLQLKD